MQNGDVALVVSIIAGALDPSIEMSMRERKLAIVGEVSRIIEADVWIWVTGTINPKIRGDAMVTSFVDEGFDTQNERADFLRVMIHPELTPVVTAPFYDAVRTHTPITKRRQQLISQSRWKAAPISSVWSKIGFDDFIISVHPVGKSGHSAVGFHRRKGRPLFTARQSDIAHLVLQNVTWLHRAQENEAVATVAIGLSPRERQVLLFLIDGDSRKQIARKLSLSEHTVNDYLKAIYRKFDISSRAELLAKFISPESEK